MAVVNQALSFGPMQLGDLDIIDALERTLYDFPWTRGNFADSIRAGHSVWMCRVGEECVAYAVVMRALDEAHLLNLSVARAWQGKGIGRAFIEHLCDEARRLGAIRMFLEVRPSNAAGLALYRSAWFSAIGRRRGYYPARQGREDAIVMTRDL
jgi:ribosomal-protein-alanine N-acetyltransferase